MDGISVPLSSDSEPRCPVVFELPLPASSAHHVFPLPVSFAPHIVFGLPLPAFSVLHIVFGLPPLPASSALHIIFPLLLPASSDVLRIAFRLPPHPVSTLLVVFGFLPLASPQPLLHGPSPLPRKLDKSQACLQISFGHPLLPRS